MKKIIYAFILTSLFLTSCNRNDDKSLNEKDVLKTGISPKEDSKEIKKSGTIDDSIQKMTLDQLIANYVNKTPLFNLDNILTEIDRRHKISPELYNDYHKDFWGNNTAYVLPVDAEYMKQLVGPPDENNEKYIQFTFSKEKEAKDFNYEMVEDHVFNSYVSCFPVLLLKDIVNDVDFGSLYLIKGIKTFPPPAKNPPVPVSTKYKGKYAIAMLIYIDKNNKVQYYDISDDPGH